MNNPELIADIWILFSEFVDKRQQNEAAKRYVSLLDNRNVRTKTLLAAAESDVILEQAVQTYLDEEDDDEDEVDELEF